MKQFALIFSAIACLGVFSTQGSATTISYAEAARDLAAACGADISAHCKDVKPGADRIALCLANKSAQISGACKQTYAAVFASLAARAAAQAAAPKLCASDTKRICSNFRAGEASILGCLTRKDNVHKVKKKCNEAITEAGWR